MVLLDGPVTFCFQRRSIAQLIAEEFPAWHEAARCDMRVAYHRH